MTVDFPALCPTRRSLRAGEYPTKRFDSISGASVTRLYGSKAFNAQLQLTYLLGDDDMAAVLQSYHASYGGADDLNLPEIVYGGMSEDLQAQIRSYYSWRWSAPPSVESVFPGRSRIQVTLIGTLDA